MNSEKNFGQLSSWACRQFTSTVFLLSVDRFLVLVCHAECKRLLNGVTKI